MKNVLSLFAIAACLFLNSCAHMDAGIREYTTNTVDNGDGTSTVKSTLARSISADMPGLTKLKSPSGLELTFSDQVQEEQIPIYDKDKNFLTTITRKTLPGFYPSKTILASGEKSRAIIKEGGATATGVILSTVLPPAVGAGAPGVAGALIKP